ncbi:MAG: fibronectin type III domain-containing protein [Polyangiaceae bacterium]|nr:fibronectin type III domain-containing protein [Polyangiaceae bacterium]MCW5791480.1 fibronectin type III domain-containing protein [Polyangiaceae bacterium]
MRRRIGLAGCLAMALMGCGGGDDLPASDDGGAEVDREPPVFAGVRAATTLSEEQVDLSWDAAEDDVSDAARLVYRVYVAAAGEAFSFDAPFISTASGATQVRVGGLQPGQDHRFIVRAVDEAGNEDANRVEASSATPDDTPPRFAGVTRVTAASSTSIGVEWNAAVDAGTPQGQLVYHAFLSVAGAPFDFGSPSAVSSPGQSSLVMNDLLPLTDYSVVVRAVDRHGNSDTNVLSRGARTPEGVPPLFGGATQAIADGQSITLYWAPASDNVTGSGSLLYDIFEATQDRGQDFSRPSYTSQPGQISFVVSGLAPHTKFYYVVRARDAAGNRDSNTAQVNATTTGDEDTTAPTFAGVEAVEGTSPSTLTVRFSAGSDDTTPVHQLRYDVYVAETSGAQDFGAPTLITPPGVTHAVITGLPPSATRHVVVRARDLADQVSSNAQERSGTTLPNTTGNLTAPTWAAGPSISVNVSLGALDVSWTAANDDNHAASDIRYHLCAEQDASRCLGASFNRHIRATTEFGMTNARLTNLLSRAVYHVFVRAEDRSGNLETGNHSASAATPVSYRYDILPLWRHACGGCHSFSHATTVLVPGGFVDPNVTPPFCGAEGCGLPLVWPGQPENSMIYRRINPRGLTTAPFSPAAPNDYVGVQEPRDGAGTLSNPLTGAQDGLIRDWIEQGAFAN